MGNTCRNIAIVGAGPAGIFSALFLAKKYAHELQSGKVQIHIFEKNNSLGKKLQFTGGGRMNISNKMLNPDTFFSSNTRKKNHFFKSHYFEPSEVIDGVQQFSVMKLFDELEIKYFWEGKRAILKSENARLEVHNFQQRLAKTKNIVLHIGTEVTEIQQLEMFETILWTTGGMFQVRDRSIPNTSSSKKQVYGVLEELGHRIIPPTPSLSPFRFSQKEREDLQFSEVAGQSFRGKIYAKNIYTKKMTEVVDDILVTHVGLSGPAILDFSAVWDKQSVVYINFVPQYTEHHLQQKLQALRNGKNSLLSFFSQFLSKKLVKFLFYKAKVQKIYFADITKQEMKRLVSVFCAFVLPKPQFFPYQACWTTKGGVSLSDINVATLESKKRPNMFIAGEVLDIDGLCGGYHISLCILQAKIISDNI